jgi:diaminopimelate epimerase
MQFTKMHGIGNDYIYINGFEQNVRNPATLAKAISDRHFGVGGDGLVLILPSQQGDVRMQMFNSDGSEGMMCGNAIRCVAKFSHEQGIAVCNPVQIETASGIKTIDKITNSEGKVTAAIVDMGEPILIPREIPVDIDGENVVAAPLDALGLPDGGWMKAAGLESEMTCVSMGNPHVVLFCGDVWAVPLEQIGPIVEYASIFPDRVNLHVVSVQGAGELTMRTWERGSGITLACGTGASAVGVAAVLTGRGDRKQLIHLAGGDLEIEWREDNNHVFMTGSATEVFTGEWLGR